MYLRSLDWLILCNCNTVALDQWSPHTLVPCSGERGGSRRECWEHGDWIHTPRVWGLEFGSQEQGKLRLPLACSAGQPLSAILGLLCNIKCFSFQVARHVSAFPWGISASAALRPAASQRTCLTNVLWSGYGQAKFTFSTSKCYALVSSQSQKYE